MGEKMGIQDRDWFKEDAKRRQALPWKPGSGRQDDKRKSSLKTNKTLVYSMIWIGLIVFLYLVMSTLKRG